jgi:hypothetical protein
MSEDQRRIKYYLSVLHSEYAIFNSISNHKALHKDRPKLSQAMNTIECLTIVRVSEIDLPQAQSSLTIQQPRSSPSRVK